jgi:hypothetical protein
MVLWIACDHIAGLRAASKSVSLGDADPSQRLAGLIRPHLGQRLTSILPPLSHELSASVLLIRRYVMAITYVFGERRFTAATDKTSQNCGLARTNAVDERCLNATTGLTARRFVDFLQILMVAEASKNCGDREEDARWHPRSWPGVHASARWRVDVVPAQCHQLRGPEATVGAFSLRKSSGNLAIFAAIRRASSRQQFDRRN